ncbi:MAG: hypothetical protein HKO02_15610 [Hyphomonadaceae bacterium]|nr:hypothetical protein [Hyphomonadaceae bacterium]
MLLRSLTKHVRDQNWFAVFLDFFIVVAGILIAFQITNWNVSRAEFQKETSALVELRKELLASVSSTQAKSMSYQQATDAGKRSLAFLESQKDCGENCWNIIVDFMHASQWQDLRVSYSSYQNMRNQGFPKSIVITDAVEVYIAHSTNNAVSFDELPIYRSLVRQHINIKAQEFYWSNCWSFIDGVEKYNLDCPEGMSNDEAKLLIDQIVKNPEIKPQLTEWIGAIVSLPQTLVDQNIAAQKAIDLISKELEKR